MASSSDIEARRTSFSSVTADYARTRPAYPVEAIGWLLDGIEGDLLDLGCGPGKLTTQLVDGGFNAIGIDPSIEMLRETDDRRVGWVCGTAEAIPLRDGCVAAITAAQAFHWFDLTLALTEIHRVLRSDGQLALIWNIRDERATWVAALSAIIGSDDAQAATMGDAERFKEDPSHGEIGRSGLFGPLETKVFPYEQPLDLEGLLGLVRSRSHFAVRSPSQREELLGAVKDLWRTHPDLQGRERFSMPYKTHAFRAVAI